MNFETLKTVGRFLLNKLAVIVVTLALLWTYKSLPADEPVPFAELLYLLILITGATVLAPLVRLLVFPEAAEYAEGRSLRQQLEFQNVTPALKHYWFATSISYLLVIACAASLSH